MPDARRYLVDDVVIMGDQENSAFVALCRATLSALIDSRSKWLVGSSSTRTLGFCSISLQKISRADSPPDRARVGLRASSPLKSIWPSRPRSSHLPRLGDRIDAATRRQWCF